MLKEKSSFYLLLQRLSLLMIFYTICRLLFLIFNFSYFGEFPSSRILSCFWSGLRFDICIISIVNLPFIVIHIAGAFGRFFYSRACQVILQWLFFLVNLPLLLLNFIDTGFFSFSGKRATADAFRVMGYGEDFINTAPQMVLSHWPLLLLYLALAYLLVRLYKRISITGSQFLSTHMLAGKLALFLLFTALEVLAFRGGIQYRPINILTASRSGSVKDAALILNTPFSVIKTMSKESLQKVNFFPEEVADRINPLVRVPSDTLQFRNLNVVIIILESFGKEYIGSLNNHKGYTPFLDSLIGQSLVFTNAYANGKRSIEAIPAILSGIPALMNEPYITSAYSSNEIASIASLLKSKNYNSTFFHGGTNGTMGFDHFTGLAGYDRYFGRREFGQEKQFDGTWGIYDEPFLQRVAEELSATKQPFHSVVFTLTSHHPYSIPDDPALKFTEGTLPIHRSIMYADYSLRRFFEAASTSDWFGNTLFVITADHTAQSEYPFYQGRAGMYAVPLIFYHRDIAPQKSSIATQHIDILPSVMDYLHFDQPYFSFGRSVFSDSTYAVNFLNDTWQLIRGDYSFILDTAGTSQLYRFTADSLMQHDISKTHPAETASMDSLVRAIIQHYANVLTENRMTVEKFK